MIGKACTQKKYFKNLGERQYAGAEKQCKVGEGLNLKKKNMKGWRYYGLNYVLCCAERNCSVVCNSMRCSPSGSSVLGDSPDKNTRVGCHALLQRIFPTQGSNPGLLHCRQILYHLSHQRSPNNVTIFA